MKTLKGPGIFLAQYAGNTAPFDTLPHIARWAASLGFVGVQIPTNDTRLFDLEQAAASKTYCDDIAGMLAEHGLAVTELSTHLQGQLVASHPAYDALFDGFAPPALRGNVAGRQAWAVQQLKLAAKASEHFGLKQADLISERRNRSVARPRQAAMWLAKQLTTRSLPDIGRRFGGRDHTTVLHAVRRIEELKATDGQLSRDLETLMRKLRG